MLDAESHLQVVRYRLWVVALINDVPGFEINVTFYKGDGLWWPPLWSVKCNYVHIDSINRCAPFSLF